MKAAETYKRLSESILGKPEAFSRANRFMNAVIAVTFLICLILLPFNIAFGLEAVAYLLVGVMILLPGLFYLSRFRKLHFIAAVIFGIGSYVTLIITYIYNSGLYGPTPITSFLVFSLLMGFTNRRLQKLWVVLQLAVGMGLMTAEFYIPGFIREGYHRVNDRYIDFISAYAITIIFMSGIIIYLRKAYSAEKKLVTERSKELEEANSQKAKLFSIVAHDLKTPLSGLTGYLELLNAFSMPEEQKKTVEKQLLVSVKQTTEMLTNLLMWAKSQMDGMVPNITDISLRATLEPVFIQIKELAAAKQIRLHVHIDEDIFIRADKDMLSLTIRNLLHNAVKFTPANGSVIVSAERQDKVTRIVIIDNGVGITEEQREHLFTVRTRSSYGTEKEKGFGIGLMLCKEFTELQNGTIGYVSMPEKGSKFFVEFPTASLPVYKTVPMMHTQTSA